jgi:signal transduction histidine kinase
VGKLASGIAHELGTPLNVVSGRAQLIQESVPASSGDKIGAAELLEVADHARIIVEQSRRMSAIIRQLLDFARRRGVRKAAYDLRQLVAQTVSMLQNLAGKRGVALVVEPDPATAPAFAQVDASQMQQVLTNVVVNAIQSMPTGGTVTLSLRPSSAQAPQGEECAAGERWEIAVKDEGEGIGPEVLPRVFEPFFTTKAVGEATGLGLSVAYGIVQEHGGFITAESEPGKGSRFAIHLPRGES